MIPWLELGQPFPPVEAALSQPNGLLAAGDELTPERLVEAYSLGIFPWYAEGEPVLWWSPDPRMVLAPGNLRVSRSLARALREASRDEGSSPAWDVRLDVDFARVMRECAAPREGQDGTWITDRVVDAYAALAARGLAHSVEVRYGGELVGGLYGVSLGRMFFGESMFARRANASKIALAALVQILLREGCPVIDCQQNTRHLASLGAALVPRREFCERLRREAMQAPMHWDRYRGAPLNALLG
jgi:leucyl/phenylalanyl-tRNA--protein transferase